MSERKLKPSASRRCVHASISRAGSTTSVVSPCASRNATSPGTASKLSSRSPERSDGTNQSRGKCAAFFAALGGDSPNLVGRRHARLDLLLQPDDPLDE